MFRKYIREHYLKVVLFALVVGIFMLLAYLDNQQVRIICYGALLCGSVGALFMLIDFLRYKARHKRLQEILLSNDFSGSALPVVYKTAERDYQEIIKKLLSQREQERADTREYERDLADYYSMWTHQIKVPITSLRLSMQGDSFKEVKGTQAYKEMQMSVFRIEEYVEMALSFARLEGEGSDYRFEVYDLDEIIKDALKSYSTMFILKKLSLEYEGTTAQVLTDRKWLGFIIRQLLSNALKYTPAGKIGITVLTTGESVQLAISDTGIGIREEDLPRIFEQGFTGFNGRMEQKSTGIGLYLCKSVSERLGHRIFATSSGKGSTFYVEIVHNLTKMKD